MIVTFRFIYAGLIKPYGKKTQASRRFNPDGDRNDVEMDLVGQVTVSRIIIIIHAVAKAWPHTSSTNLQLYKNRSVIHCHKVFKTASLG